MKIFAKEQIYEGDKLTAERQKISSTELMERAGTQIFNWLHTRMQGAQVPIHVFCGIGNNGGDGLVIARLLYKHGYNVNCYVVNFSDKRTKEFLTNYHRLKELRKWPTVIHSENDFPEVAFEDIVVDAIFGNGLNKPIAKWFVNLFQHFKKSRAFTLSIDIPSGLYTFSAVGAVANDVRLEVYSRCSWEIGNVNFSGGTVLSEGTTVRCTNQSGTASKV